MKLFASNKGDLQYSMEELFEPLEGVSDDEASQEQEPQASGELSSSSQALADKSQEPINKTPEVVKNPSSAFLKDPHGYIKGKILAILNIYSYAFRDRERVLTLLTQTYYYWKTF